MASDIIKFPTNLDDLQFDEYMSNDPYLQLTAANAMTARNYIPNTEGTIEFQKEFDEEPTGIIDIKTFGKLIQIFEPETIQGIYSYINDVSREAQTNNKKSKKEKKDDKDSSVTNIKLAIWLVVLLFFEVVGFITCWRYIFENLLLVRW